MTGLRIDLLTDRDIVGARARARSIAEAAGLTKNDPVRFATAVSEVARNAVKHGTRGTLEVHIDEGPPRRLVALVRDAGQGFRDPHRLLDAGTEGLSAARKMVDLLELRNHDEGGAEVRLVKFLPKGTPPPRANVTSVSSAREGENPGVYEELFAQNHELARALAELRMRESELERVNRELEETNRGVVALYAELDQRAELLARASETKSRFLSFMSHEFRTPLAAIVTLTELLAAHSDGPLTLEQERQVRLIRRSADTLSRLVEDLLDLAKIEAGKLSLRVTDFSASDVLAAVRGVVKNLPRSPEVSLEIADATPEFALRTDEDKLAQVLRNLVSNALKFTEHGEVRLRTTLEGDTALFECSDTGIGIAAADLQKIFDEFSQVDSPTQRRVRGTGLGLPIARKLVQLMRGTLEVESEPGRGSTFRVRIPCWSSHEDTDEHG